ncbi:MAG TPA: Asp-tRNA(Asn)/Glu-tRNA(Gln) amidotransferase subunit GatC [Clostridiaceae bacterium]|nr:Asp-tRNA(Asn)/Glu-tRNA(Gln) amidotransferase subunit GatC [Clostridiaceae bacterium]
MTTDREKIKKVADLANIHIGDDELESFAGDMNAIIGYMEQIKNIDTGDMKPMEHVLPVYNAFREDVPGESFDRDELLKNAPEAQDGCFKVPVVVET